MNDIIIMAAIEKSQNASKINPTYSLYVNASHYPLNNSSCGLPLGIT